MEMIVMDEHNTMMQATVRMDKLKRFQHHLKEGNALTIQRYSLVHGFVWRPFKSITDLEKEEDGQFDKNMLLVKLLRVRISRIMIKMEKQEKTKLVTLIDDEIVLVLQFAMMKFWDDNFYESNLTIVMSWGTKLYLFDGNKAIYEDEYKEVEECRQRCKTKRITYVNMEFCLFKKIELGFLKSMITLKWEGGIVGDFSVIDGHLEKDAFLVDNVEGGLFVDNTNARIDGGFNSGSNKDKGKELWDSLESKYMVDDSSSKKFLDFKHTLKHGKDDLSLVQLGSHLRIEESLRAQDSDKGKGKEVVGPSVNMTEEGKNKNNKQNKGNKRDFKEHGSGSGSNKKPKLECWKCGKTSHFKRDCCSGNKKNANAGGSKKGSKDHSQDQGQNLVPVWNRFVKFSVLLISEAFYVQVDAIAWWIDFGATTHVCKDHCWFKTYELVEDGCVLYMGDDHFAPIHGKESVVLEFSLGKSITLFNVLYVPKLRYVQYKRMLEISKDELIHTIDKNPDKSTTFEGSRDQVGSQYSYCYSIKEDPRTYNEAMQSRDAAFWKKAIDDEIGSIMENNTWVLSDLPPSCKPLAFLNGDLEEEVYMKQPKGFVMPGNEHKVCKLVKSLFSMKYMGEANDILGIKIKRKNTRIVITQPHYIEKILKKFNREDCSPVSTPMDPVEKLKPNTGKPLDQLEYSTPIGCLIYAMTSTRPDIAYAVEAYSDASWINHVEDSFSTSGWVFLLGGGAISWASKKQTCITGSTIESEFVALAAAGKEAESLRNLIHEIPIWPKPIAPISIRCDSAATLAKAYSQIYNGKSRHLGVRHSMIRELIRNDVISIEFVRSQHNLADHLTKGLARDLVI
uniref:Zinc finger, CCHC-type n=1 Tax=Tanacetum cinerariifolium TaxID=118510 RepID=A0A6L2K0N2_TANCI|nr:zinc finger, CCHC-type [Tanacetum cinerariifolium]